MPFPTAFRVVSIHWTHCLSSFLSFSQSFSCFNSFHDRSGGEPISGAIESGFSAESGPALFNDLATEMAEDILELSESTATTLCDKMLKGFGIETVLDDTDETSPSLPLLDGPAKDDDLVVGRVLVNARTGICPQTGAKQRLFQLEKDQRQHVYDTLFKMTREQYEEFSIKLKAKFGQVIDEPVDGYAVEQLQNFTSWLA